MTARIAHRLAHERSTSPCSRCLSFVALAAGDWRAVEPVGLDRVVCDRCARRDDTGGYAHLLAWRRVRGYCSGATRPTHESAA